MSGPFSTTASTSAWTSRSAGTVPGIAVTFALATVTAEPARSVPASAGVHGPTTATVPASTTETAITSPRRPGTTTAATAASATTTGSTIAITSPTSPSASRSGNHAHGSAARTTTTAHGTALPGRAGDTDATVSPRSTFGPPGAGPGRP
jgi:hypothetical protein